MEIDKFEGIKMKSLKTYLVYEIFDFCNEKYIQSILKSIKNKKILRYCFYRKRNKKLREIVYNSE